MLSVPFLVALRLWLRGPCLPFETSELGDLEPVRGSLVVGFSSLCPFLCSPSVLGSPLVGLLSGAFRSLCLIYVDLVFFFCCSGLFSLETPDLRRAVVPFFLSAFFSLSFVSCCCLCSVRLSFFFFVFFVAVRRVVLFLFLFLAGVAACFVSLFCGGCAWGVLCSFSSLLA